ncbi:MAG: TIGR02281 family clan AA aspartic protease [Alphaproteobacteria bacterium]|nr:TIGR02281 family clan AA aspartic protease [Alphaproteobacteria bacterium]MBL7097193.1 TIGR02281 family clan AA aspartic protease [Alphaproteobacteria bacterium]
MSNPWQRPPRPHFARVYVWLGVLLALSALVWALFHFFPEVSPSDYDTAWAIQWVGIAALLSASLIFSRRVGWNEALRNIAIWLAVAGVLAIGFTFRGTFENAFAPAEPHDAGNGTVTLSETEAGDYQATGTVNGVRVLFAVDTGASDIVLSPADARRAGIAVDALTYDKETTTANGLGHGASVTLGSLTLGPIRLADVRATVNQSGMDRSLLGMTFLRRMKSVTFTDHTLTLRWR